MRFVPLKRLIAIAAGEIIKFFHGRHADLGMTAEILMQAARAALHRTDD
jgi:hypothetical protein